MMQLIDVKKTYQQGTRIVEALRGVHYTIEAGDFLSIMGPSGSGKSSLMHLLGTLDTPTSGQVLFQGQDVNQMSDRGRSILRRTKIGFVFQFFNLLPTLRAAENVALPLMLGGTRKSIARRQAEESLDRVGMGYRKDHFPEEMSGGEMQRIAIARALVTNPDAILCDEPTGNLDSKTSGEILQLLRSLSEPGRRSVVMVTHDRGAAEVADKILHIQDGLIARVETVTRSR
jgi:putative ABC transport system ATP-binding protein